MKRRIVFVSLMLFAALCFINTEKAEAKTVKISIRHSMAGKKQYSVITAKTSSGKVVWKYKTKKYAATELDATTMRVKGNRVYAFENGKMLVFNKKTGKKLVNKKHVLKGYQVDFIVDSSGNCYAQPYYMDLVYKVSAKGKILWKRNMSKTKLSCPGKMKIKKDAVRFYYDSESPEPYEDVIRKYIDFDKKTGKILKYKAETGVVRETDDMSMEEAEKKVRKYVKAGDSKKYVIECDREDKKYYYFVVGYDNGYSIVFNRLCHYRVHKKTGKIKVIDEH